MTVIRFGDLFAEPLRNGVSYPGRDRGSGIPMINMGEIFAFDRLGDLDYELAPLSVEEQVNFLVQEGDLLFARQSLTYEGAGKCALVVAGGERTWESHLIRARLNQARALPSYYFYYFRSPTGRRSIESIVQQVAAAGIRGSDLASLMVPLPPLHIQQATVAVLTALDDKIANNTALASTAGDLAVAHAATAPSTCMLGEIARLDRTMIKPGSLAENRVLHYSLPAFDAGVTPVLDSPDDIRSSKFWMATPRVLVSKLNPRIPRIWAVDETTGLPGLASTEFMPLLSEVISYKVLWAAVSGPDFGRRLEAQVAGTSGSHQRVRPEDLMSTEVADPRLLSARTTDLINSLVSVCIQARSESGTLRELRDTLLPALMSGRLRVKDAERQLEDAV